MSLQSAEAVKTGTGMASGAESGAGGASARAKKDLRGLGYEEQNAALDPGAVAEPEPGDTPAAPEAPARVSGDPIPTDIREDLFTKLAAIPRVKEVLDAIEAAKGLDFPIKWSDQGTFQSGGAIYLRTTSTPESWVASLAHELVHLQTYVEGKAANAAAQTKEEFVAAKMDDEINAQVTTYVALLQQGETSNSSAGFDEFYAFLTADHAEALTGKKWTEIATLARTWMVDKYKNEWVTNNTQENYYTYWGNHWDDVNGVQ
ncbi:MAG: hypothetical protein RBU45_23315 [Myxococcota bacterium]|jgi:hypothetical protein|nr:hypothetical protein [Myxococcota bacterium]